MIIEAHRKILFFAIVLVLLSPLPANAACGGGSSDFKLISDNPVPTNSVSAQFGHAVAVSGNNMVVGVTAEQTVYVFSYDEDNDNWTQEPEKLTVPGPAAFGWSVAIDGNTLVVGNQLTAAYVWRKNEKDEWIEENLVIDGNIPFGFGFSVAVSGDTVVVGSYWAGLTYVFKRQTSDDTSAEWFQEELPITPLFGNGWAVAISGDTLVVGNPFAKSAQVFTRSDSTGEPIWTEDTTLTGGVDDDGVDDDKDDLIFGVSVAIDIDGDTIVVGAPPYLNALVTPDPEDLLLPGSAHVFSRRELADGTWQWDEDQKLPLPETTANGFGLSVAISGDSLVVGAPNDTDDEGTITGAAYLFKYKDSNWVEDPVQPNLIPTTVPGLEEGDQFGWSVAIDGSNIVVGSPSNVVDSGFLKAGAAYVFTANDETPVSVVQSTLGRSHHRFFPAWEIFEFTAAEGDKATLIFEADPNGSNNHGKGVSLFVKDKIRGERFFMKKRWALGDPMPMEFHADGDYRVVVFGHPWFFRNKGFRGDYTLKLEGICGGLRKVSRRNKWK